MKNSDVAGLTTDDPFQDVDEAMTLGPLISTAMGCIDSCSVEDYVNGDSLQVCPEIDSEHWEANFMETLTQDVYSHPTTLEENSDNEDLDIPPPSPKIKNFKEAIKALEDVQIFLESHGCVDSAHKNSVLLNSVAADCVCSLKQSTLDHFTS